MRKCNTCDAKQQRKALQRPRGSFFFFLVLPALFFFQPFFGYSHPVVVARLSSAFSNILWFSTHFVFFKFFFIITLRKEIDLEIFKCLKC